MTVEAKPRVGYFPGCSLEGAASDYGLSVRAVTRALGVDLVELPDWSCCGATAAHCLDQKLARGLPGRNLKLAEQSGIQELLAPCAACSSRLLTAHAELAQYYAHAAGKPGVDAEPYRGTVRVLNFLQFLAEHCLDGLRERIVRRLEGLKVACYYGCLLLRPPKIMRFDDPDAPTTMERIIEELGAEPVDWAFKTECCGAGFSVSNTDIVLGLSAKVLRNAKGAGANAVAVVCPMCHSNLDMRQRAIEKRLGAELRLPIYYLSDLIGLALGLSEKELGIDRHFVKAAI